MSIFPDDLKRQTFPCPQCGQIISSDDTVCRFCSEEIDDELRTVSVHKELREQSLARIKTHKLYMAAGAAVFVAGIGSFVLPFIEAKLGSRMVNFSCWTPLLVFGGLGAATMGFRGYLREKKYLKDV